MRRQELEISVWEGMILFAVFITLGLALYTLGFLLTTAVFATTVYFIFHALHVVSPEVSKITFSQSIEIGAFFAMMKGVWEHCEGTTK